MTSRVSFALGKGSHVSDGEAPTRVPVGAFQSVPIRELSRHLALDIPESFLWSSGIRKTVANKVTPTGFLDGMDGLCKVAPMGRYQQPKLSNGDALCSHWIPHC